MSDKTLQIILTAKDVTGQAFTSLQSRVKSISASVLSLQGAFFGLAGAAGIGAMIKSSFDLNDKLAKTSDRLGLTTGALAGLRHAAELSGAGADTLDMALQRMTRRIAEAATGSGEAVSALKELGLSAQELNTLPTDEKFKRIAEAMGNVKGESNKVRLAFKLFDSEGVKLVNTLAMGSAGLNDAAQEAKDLGIAISRIDAAKIEAANDAFYRAQQAIKGIGNTLAVELAPIAEQTATAFANLVKQNQALIQVKAAEYIGEINDKLQHTMDIYNAIPDGALTYGILGRLLFGSWGPAAMVASLGTIATSMEELARKAVELGGHKWKGGWLDTISQIAKDNEIASVEKQIDSLNKKIAETVENQKSAKGYFFGDAYQEQIERYSGQVDQLKKKLESLKLAQAESPMQEGGPGFTNWLPGDTAAKTTTTTPATVQTPTVDTVAVADAEASLDEFYRSYDLWVQKLDADTQRVLGVSDDLHEFFDEIDSAKQNTKIDAELDNYFGELDQHSSEYKKKLEQQNVALQERHAQMIELSNHTAAAMQENFSSLFYDAVTGQFTSLDEYVKAIFQSIEKAWFELLAKMAVQQLFGLINGDSGGGSGGGDGTSFLGSVLSAVGGMLNHSGSSSGGSGGNYGSGRLGRGLQFRHRRLPGRGCGGHWQAVWSVLCAPRR